MKRLAAFIFFASFVSATPVTAISPNAFTSAVFDRHVASGKLSPQVREQLDLDGHASFLVILEDADIENALSVLRKAQSHRRDTSEVVRERNRLIKGKKDRLLAGLSKNEYEILKDYDHFPIIYLHANRGLTGQLLESGDVRSIREDRAFSPGLTQSLPLIKADVVHNDGLIGTDTSVAVLDTGVNYTLSAFGSCTAPGTPGSCKVAYAADIAPDDGSLDNNGHGTNVAGIVLGVAPDTRILALDVFRSNGYAYDSDLLTALNWVLNNRATYSVASVNMSLGGGGYAEPCPADTLASPITYLRNVDIITTIATGNNAYNGLISSPACVPDAVSVGAVYDSNVGAIGYSVCSDTTTAADKVTCFTNTATFLTILAPGALITAAGSTYAGTSQATPHVAGAAAVLKSAHPALTGDNIVDQLTTTGTPLTYTRQSSSYTQPRLDLDAATRYPDIVISPSTHDFGWVAPGGSSSTLTVTITNNGLASLLIQSISLSGTNVADFNFGSDTCSMRTLAPSSSCSLLAGFSPQVSGIRTAGLVIPNNDPDIPEAWVGLNGSGGTPFTFSVTKGRYGSGRVTSTPSGIDCGITCSALFNTGTEVMLTPVPDDSSVFVNWSGDCSGSGTCNPTVTAATAVMAVFDLKPVKLSSGLSTLYYSSLSEAYNLSAGGDTIQLKSGTITADLLFNLDIPIVIEGGYDANYTAPDGVTTVAGSLTVASGTVTVSNLVIQ